MATRQKEKSKQTEKELMSAATELFGSKGFFATTVAEITKKAGYAKGSFYRHFESKDDIVLKIIEDKLRQYRSERKTRIEQAKTLEEVVEVIWDFLDLIMEDRNWSRVFLEFTIHASRNEELKAKLNDGRYRLSDRIFADLISGHLETDYPLEKVGALNTALFEGFLIHGILDTGVLSKDDVRKAALTLALARGKKGPGPR